MAEGWTRQLKSDELEAFSAGIENHGLNQNAIKVMAEAGVDISQHRSQLLDEFDLSGIDYIVTVCNHARESCPLVPDGCLVFHKSFDDPPRLAQSLTAEQDILDCYRKVRDEIKEYVQLLPGILTGRGKSV